MRVIHLSLDPAISHPTRAATHSLRARSILRARKALCAIRNPDVLHLGCMSQELPTFSLRHIQPVA